MSDSASAAPALVGIEPMSLQALQTYVRSSAELLALPLAPGQALRVAEHLARTAALASLLEEFELQVEQEPVSVYCPAAFPTQEGPCAEPAEQLGHCANARPECKRP